MSYPPLGYAYPSAAASLASTQLLMSAAQANITTSSSSTSCCESGRPIFTDPQTGHTICSCQFTPSLLAYPRVAALSDSYTAAAAAYAAQGYAAAFGADPSAFYSPLNAAAYNELKDNPEAAWRLAQPAACYPYDPAAMAAYSYGGYAGMDLNQARRKNATRETTSTLKAWLYEHRKNPYPTKGEKIMLAIITKMTLTQVSTWFANARRRLKKENKMTWSPRNRCGDEDEDGDGKDGDSDVDDKDLDSDKEDDDLRDLSVHSNDRSTPPPSSPRHTPTPEENSPDKQTHRPGTPSSSTPTATKESRKSPSPVKPRIWSLAHVATSGNNDRKSPISTAFPTSPKPGQPYPSAIHTLSHWVDGRYPTHLRLPHPYSFPPIAHTTTTSSLPGGTPSTGASTKIATPLPSSIRYPPALSRLPTSSISDERKSEHSLPSSDKTTSATTAFRPVVKGSFPSAIKT